MPMHTVCGEDTGNCSYPLDPGPKQKKKYSSRRTRKKSIHHYLPFFKKVEGVNGVGAVQLTVSALWAPHTIKADFMRHRVFGLERIERERRDLVDFEGLAWGGVLPSWCMP